jgi:DNA-directed RNA polymerase subunit RPC12/RpoP
MENTPPGNRPQLNVNLSEVPYLECEECGHMIFEERLMIKKVSRFMTGGEQDSIVPLQVISCAKCGHVNEMFKPKV